MAITLIIGNPGDGKSYGAMQLCVLPAIKSGRPLYTNLKLNMEAIIHDHGIEEIIDEDGSRRLSQYIVSKPDCTKQDLLRVPGGALIVLDELWKLWPADQSKKAVDPDEQSFFAEHRHKTGRVGDVMMSQDIVIISQDSGDIARFIKSRVESTFIVSKLKALGQDKRFKLSRYRGVVSINRPLKSKFESESFGTYSPDVWKYYVSHTKSEGASNGGLDMSIVEPGAAKRKTVFTSFRFLFYVGTFFLALLFFVFQVGSNDGQLISSASVPASTSAVAAPAPSPGPVPGPVPGPGPAPGLAPGPAPSPGSVPSPGPAPDPGPVADVLPVSVASRFWISGHLSKPSDPDYLHLVLTDGVNTFSVRVASDRCATDGVLFCTVAGHRFNTVPLIQRRSEPVVPKAQQQAKAEVQIAYTDP